MVAASAGNTLNGACEIRADGAAGGLAALSTQVCGEHPRNPDHKLAIHVRRHGTTCSTLPAFASCRDIATTYAGCGDLDFIPVFFDLNEVTAVDFGVTWPAEWGSCVFALCPCDAWIGGIQKPGDGLGASWDSCKRSWAVAPGYGWLRASGPGLISPVPWGPYKELGVWNCGRAEKCRHDSTTALLPAGVCGRSGGDPCEPVVPRPAGAGVIEHPPR
jgi:hypothetical protein